MKTVSIYMAQAIDPEEKLEPVTVVMDTPLPDTHHHRSNALKLADVLYGTLPAGTLDELLIEMLTRTKSGYVVRHRQ